MTIERPRPCGLCGVSGKHLPNCRNEDEQTRQARAGHSTTENARRYAHTTTAEDRAAAAALERMIG